MGANKNTLYSFSKAQFDHIFDGAVDILDLLHNILDKQFIILCGFQ